MTDDERWVTETDDGSLTLYHPEYGQTYHSRYGALQEAEHVFLRGAGIEARLRQGLSTRILEVGFGLSLNFFLTARMGQDCSTAIDYVALERDLPSSGELASMAYAQQLGLADLGDQFLAWRDRCTEPMEDGTYEFRYGSLLQLQLLLGDACLAPLEGLFDAVYLDAFSPDVNPELWTESFFRKLARVLVPGGRLATYSARGSVRRGLQAAGLEVVKHPGPPGKREMVVATRPV